MLVGTPIVGHYNHWLVLLSFLIAILAAYATLDLAGRINFSHGSSRLIWLTSGAISFGSGIWAMHYIGMAALQLPVPVRYDWPTVLLSWLAAIGGAQVAMYVIGGRFLSTGRIVFGSLSMGGAIAAMHYIGMEAMRLPADHHYLPVLVIVSVILAVLISFAGIRLAFIHRTELSSWTPRKFLAALFLGLSIPTMHYVGMAAVTFTSRSDIPMGTSNAILVSIAGKLSIALASLLLLSLVTVASAFDRRIHSQKQQIAANEKQLQAIFDNMIDPIAVVDLDLKMVRANPAFYLALNVKEEEFTTVIRDPTEVFGFRTPRGDPIAIQDWPMRRALRGDFMIREKFQIWRQNEEASITAEITTSPIRDEHNNIYQIIAAYHDVTERQKSNENRARLAAIVDSSQDAIIGKDVNGIIQSWNAAAERIFGYTAEEMLGESIMRLVPPNRQNEEREFLSRIRQGEAVDHVETTRRRKDGKLIEVAVTISPIRDDMNRVVGASKTARDITNRKLLERQLFQSQKMEAIGQLTGGIAHDFNNLLAVIVGNLSLIERLVQGNDAILKRLHSAQRASGRGADLIRRLLTFSSKEQLNPENLSVNSSVNNMIELAGRVLGPEIHITTHLDPATPVVFADAAGLEAALLNLAVNARDAMPKGGSLTISTQIKHLDADYPAIKAGKLQPGSYVCISVADTGTGMSRETIDHVFEPFFTTKSRDKGTGLGLPMVYGFVKQSQGTVLIYSELDYGTTVNLYLPIAASNTDVTRRSGIRSPAKASPRSKVLVVDDEVELLEVAEAYLRELGHITRCAIDGKQALDFVPSNPDLDLVITDVIMPGGMNGVELVNEIRKTIPDIKVIYSSGFSADALVKRSGTFVDGYLLPKPYQRSDFESIVAQALEVTEPSS